MEGVFLSVSTVVLALAFLIILVPAQPVWAASIDWDFCCHLMGDGSSIPLSAPVIITYDDSGDGGADLGDGNIDTITILVTSPSDPAGINLVLSEDPALGGGGINSGFYSNKNLIFMNGNNEWHLTDTINIRVQNPNANTTPSPDLLTVDAYSNTNATGLPIILTENGGSTGIFTGKLHFTGSGSSSGNILLASPGDIISIQDSQSGLVTNGIILQNPPDTTVGAIKTSIGENVNASFNGLSSLTNIGNDTIPGGGGGGLVIHPGLVLDILTAIGGSPYIVSPPSFGGGYYHYSDGLTLTQGNTSTTFDTSQYNQEIPKQVMVSDTPVNMTFKTFESYNVEGVIHMGLYIIPRGQDMITDNSIGSIVWDRGQPVEVNDPNHILSDATVSPINDGKFQYITFSFTPTKSHDKMSFLVRAWNDHLYSTDIRVHDDIVAPQAVKTLPAGVIQYDNFADLQTALEKDQFYKPQLLSHIHGTTDVFPNSEGGSVYWWYDTIQHTVTLVIADKNDNVLLSKSASLQPYATEKKGDYKFMYFTVEQLNRWNEDQLKSAMEFEAEKAMSFALEKKIILHSNW